LITQLKLLSVYYKRDQTSEVIQHRLKKDNNGS